MGQKCWKVEEEKKQAKNLKNGLEKWNWEEKSLKESRKMDKNWQNNDENLQKGQNKKLENASKYKKNG